MPVISTFFRYGLLTCPLLVAIKLISWKLFNKINSVIIFSLNININCKASIYIEICSTNKTKLFIKCFTES